MNTLLVVIGGAAVFIFGLICVFACCYYRTVRMRNAFDLARDVEALPPRPTPETKTTDSDVLKTLPRLAVGM